LGSYNPNRREKQLSLQASEDHPQNPLDHWLAQKKPLIAAGDEGLLEKNIPET